MKANVEQNFKFKDKDIVAITETVVGISEENYMTVDVRHAQVITKPIADSGFNSNYGLLGSNKATEEML